MARVAPPAPSSPGRAVILWLWLCTALLLAMIVVGGVTRLTGSGLSIVRWEPVVGALPPMNEADWQKVFALYRETPQYQLVNAGMSLSEFQGIFFWEYVHRLLGRSIGMVVGLPLIYFTWKKRLDRRRALSLLGIFCLGGLQGLLGWYMVMSGLVDVPSVSHYRLTAHLGLGFLIFGLVFWQALDVTVGTRARTAAPGSSAFSRASIALLALASVTVLSGALVAGLRAGHAFPTFPLIAGAWVPPGLASIDPWWRNLLDSAITVNFQHRVLATLVFVSALALVYWTRRQSAPAPVQQAADLLFLAVCAQVALGISTLLLHVPTALAAAHQGNAALLIAACLNLVHATRALPEAEPASLPLTLPARQAAAE